MQLHNFTVFVKSNACLQLRFTNVIFKVAFLSVSIGFLAGTFRLSGVFCSGGGGSARPHSCSAPLLPRIYHPVQAHLLSSVIASSARVWRCSLTRVRQQPPRSRLDFRDRLLASVTHAHARTHLRGKFCLRGWKIWDEDVRPGAALSARRVSRTELLCFCWRLIGSIGFFWRVLPRMLRLGWCLLWYLRSFRRSLSCGWSHFGVLLNFCLFRYIRSSPVIEQTIQLMVQISWRCPSKWQTNYINVEPTDLLENIYTIIINVYFP